MTGSELQTLWDAKIPEFPLASAQAELWLALHTEAVVHKGIHTTFVKWEREQHKMDEQYLLRYASKTMNNAKSRLAEVQR